MGREPISRSQVQLHPKTGSDHNLLLMATVKIIKLTKGRRKGTRNKWLAQWSEVTTTKECNKTKWCPTREDLEEWWPRDKAWLPAPLSTSKRVGTPLASQSGSKGPVVKSQAATNKWHRCSIKCKWRHREILRERPREILNNIDKNWFFFDGEILIISD